MRRWRDTYEGRVGGQKRGRVLRKAPGVPLNDVVMYFRWFWYPGVPGTIA